LKDVETTKTVHNLVQGNLKSPFDLIEYIGKLDCAMCYSTLNKIYYKTIDTIVNNTTSSDYTFTSGADFGKFNKVELYKNPKNFNLIEYGQNGFGGLTFESIDDVYYKREVKSKTHSEGMKSFSSFGKSAVVPKALEILQRKCVYDAKNNRIKRNMFINAINTNVMDIEINGTIGIDVGSIIKLENKGFDNRSEEHELMSGKWLVTGCNSIIEPDKYIQNLRIANIAYYKKLAGVNVL
jgi:hypothetical protein